MAPAPNACGAVASLALAIPLVAVAFVIIGSTVDDMGTFTRTVAR